MKYDVLAIDNGHFFEDLEEYCSMMANTGKEIYVTALNSSETQNNYDSITKLIPKCDTIIHLTSICYICLDEGASFLTISAADADCFLMKENEYEFSENKTFVPICRKCFNFKKNICTNNSYKLDIDF
jgi:thymidine kinase